MSEAAVDFLLDAQVALDAFRGCRGWYSAVKFSTIRKFRDSILGGLALLL